MSRERDRRVRDELAAAEAALSSLRALVEELASELDAAEARAGASEDAANDALDRIFALELELAALRGGAS